MRVILAEHVADHACALDGLGGGIEAHAVHRIKDAALHGLHAVEDIGQRAALDDRQGIFEISARGVARQGQFAVDFGRLVVKKNTRDASLAGRTGGLTGFELRRSLRLGLRGGVGFGFARLDLSRRRAVRDHLSGRFVRLGLRRRLVPHFLVGLIDVLLGSRGGVQSGK